MGIDNRIASYRGRLGFSDILHESEEIVSGTACESRLPMSCEIWGREVIDNTSFFPAFPMSDGGFMDIDPVFSGKVFYYTF